MTLEEFNAGFRAESDFIERKSGTGQSPLARAITAFSNSDGGVVLIGVRDDGTVVGRGLTEGVETAIHQAALSIHDPGRYRIREFSVDDKAITIVSVARRTQGFARRRRTSPGPSRCTLHPTRWGGTAHVHYVSRAGAV